MTRDFQRTSFVRRHGVVVRALAEAFFSPGGEATAQRLDAFVAEVDAFISPASKTLRFGLLVMLSILRVSPLFYGHFRLFESLTVEERLTHLERLDHSRIKPLPLIVVAYKTVMTMLFYEDAQELANVGYPGPERKRYLTVPPTSSSFRDTMPARVDEAGL